MFQVGRTKLLPMVTWKTENVSNKLDDLSQDFLKETKMILKNELSGFSGIQKQLLIKDQIKNADLRFCYLKKIKVVYFLETFR